MLLRDPPRSTSARELKVPLPISLHLRLHMLKVRHGRLIGDVVTEALVRYLEKHAQAGGGEGPRPPQSGPRIDVSRHPSTEGWQDRAPTSTSAESSE